MAIGSMELLIVLLIGLVLAGIIAGAILLVVSLVRAQGGSLDRIATLEAEVRRLRAELDDLRRPTGAAR